MSKAEKLFDAITDVRDDLVESAQTYRFKRRVLVWKRYGSLAACLVLLLGAAMFFRIFGAKGGSNDAKSDSTMENIGSDMIWDGGAVNDSKAEAAGDDAAPNDTADSGSSDNEKQKEWHEDLILPLTIENGEDLAIERTMHLTRGETLQVEDIYLVTAPEERQITLLYPVAARLSTFDGVRITANGEELTQEILHVDASLDQLDPSNAMSHVEPDEMRENNSWIFWARASLTLPEGETVELCISYEKPMSKSSEIAMDAIPVQSMTMDGEEVEIPTSGALFFVID